jgi:hypothetical protein
MDDFDLENWRRTFKNQPRTLLDRAHGLDLVCEIDRLRAVIKSNEDPLTDERADGMLKKLAKHYGEPVMPMSRYCAGLETWARCIGERAARFREELLPHLHEWDKTDPKAWKPTPKSEAETAEYDAVKNRSTLRSLLPTVLRLFSKEAAVEVRDIVMKKETSREYKLEELVSYEEAAYQVERVFLSIRKSNLLARLLYSGEKLRTTMCPEHKGKWSGIEWGPDGVCPHKCQLTGWIQEEDDQGKPLPGVQAVMMVPTGDAPGEVTMIRSADGEVLGKAVMQELSLPEK